ncbi:MAG: CpXC domain-containing protein [Clostridia bacterium]|nr:CpXC domain-containing protein [Clostridia bacterium]
MSTMITKDVSCPNCGEPHSVDIITSINAHDNPELKEKVLDESLFDFRCDRCNYTCQVTWPLVYHDPDAGFMVIMYAQGQTGNAAEPPATLRNVVKRRVSTLAELKEKVLIFDNGLNDVAVEMVKDALWKIIEKTYQNASVEPYFSKKNIDGSLEFAIYLQGSENPVYHTIKSEVYNQSAEVLRSLDYKEENDFTQVGRELAEKLLEEYKGE